MDAFHCYGPIGEVRRERLSVEISDESPL